MLFLRTGTPGASKTLNTLKEIIENPNNTGRELYYNNIKLLMLDFDVVSSFQGWFYGIYLPSITGPKLDGLKKILKRIHNEGQLADRSDFPHLTQTFESWILFKGHIKLWLDWVKKLYPEKRLELFNLYLANTELQDIEIDHLKQFNLDWRHFPDPLLWFELPRQSIIVIDECQQWFPPRPVGSKVPQQCREFETHRHKGWDVHLVTQHHNFLDSHIRGLTNRHIHYKNLWGMNRVTRMQAEECFNPKDYHERERTVKSNITRDKRFYGLYWSADEHTNKLALPKKLLLFPLGILLILFLIYQLFGRFQTDEPSTLPASDTQQPVNSKQPQQILPQGNYSVRPFTAVSKETPISEMCTDLRYAGFELKHLGKGRYSSVHFFTCELPYNEQEQKNATEEEPFSKPQVLLDGYFMQSMGFDFEFKNNLPVLTYNGSRYVFPRY